MTHPRRVWQSVAQGAALGALCALFIKDLDLFVIVSYWGDRSPWIPAGAILGALTGSTRLRLLPAVLASGLLGLWLVVALTPLSSVMARDLVRTDADTAADAVYVLGSGLQKDGELSSVSLSRLVHALELLGRELAPRLILTELPPPHASYAAVSRKLMQNLGLTHEVIALGPVRNTRDEAVLVGRLFREREWTHILVVTSPQHSLRAALALEKEGVRVLSSPSAETGFDLQFLDSLDDRIRAFGPLLHEHVGLHYYAQRGWIEKSLSSSTQPSAR